LSPKVAHLPAELLSKLGGLAAATLQQDLDVGAAAALGHLIEAGPHGEHLARHVGEATLVLVPKRRVLSRRRHHVLELALEPLRLAGDGAQPQLDRHLGEGVGGVGVELLGAAGGMCGGRG